MEDLPRYAVDLEKNCGTGAGGFQPGNTCGAGGGSAREEAYAGKTIRPKLVVELREREDLIRRSAIEHAVAYAKNGNRILLKSGSSNHVRFTVTEIAMIKSQGGVVFTHNHPSGNAFSLDDLVLAQVVGLAELRAVAPDGTVYRVRPPKAGWSSLSKTQVEDAHIQAGFEADQLVRPKLDPLVYSDKLEPIEADRMHTHWVMQRVAKKLGLEYERVLGEGVKRAEVA